MTHWFLLDQDHSMDPGSIHILDWHRILDYLQQLLIVSNTSTCMVTDMTSCDVTAESSIELQLNDRHHSMTSQTHHNCNTMPECN